MKAMRDDPDFGKMAIRLALVALSGPRSLGAANP